MKIISYNLRSGGKTGQNNHWQRLLREFAPDFVFAQESLHPNQYHLDQINLGPEYCIHELVSHGKWGSAIWSRNVPLETVELPAFNGSVVGAKIRNPIPGDPAQFAMMFSIHAPTSKSYVAVVNKILDEIKKVCGELPLILAGDFNLTTAFRHASEQIKYKNSPQEIALLNRLHTEFGLVNAWQALNPDIPLPQTLRWSSKPSIPYHCDAIFVSRHFAPYLVSARIESAGDWGVISDHNPILVDLSLD